MEFRSNVRALSYLKKLVLGETENMLPFPNKPQKPLAKGILSKDLARALPESTNVNPKSIDTFLRELSSHSSVGAHSALIVKDGKVICEANFKPYTTKTWHVSHSLCKTFTGTAIGMLVDGKALSLDEHICDIFPEKCNFLTGRKMRSIKVRHLLTMSSGVNFKELGAVLEEDWVSAFLGSDVSFEPGIQFSYNSMNSYMLSAIVTKKTGKTLLEYLRPRLFEPLGFGDIAWETCPLGITKGGWGMYLLAEDLAKLGLLYLQKGVWHSGNSNLRIISEEWIALATAHTPPEVVNSPYGYHLWTNKKNSSYFFNGMFGQYCVVHPELKIVVVLLSGAPNLFAQSHALNAIDSFFYNIKQQTTLTKSEARKQKLELAFTLNRLRFLQPVPAYKPNNKFENLAFFKKIKQMWQPSQNTVAKTEYSILNGRKYDFENCKIGLLPLVISYMNDYYTKGVDNVSFSYFEQATFPLTMFWSEGGNTQNIPIGIDDFAYTTLNFDKNIFNVATKGILKYNEDDRLVLKIVINFLECSSTQTLKFLFNKNKMVLSIRELPSLPEIFSANPDFFKHEVGFLQELNFTKSIVNNWTHLSHEAKPKQNDKDLCLKNKLL